MNLQHNHWGLVLTAGLALTLAACGDDDDNGTGGPTDTGPTDTGEQDTGPTDTGPTDTGPADTGGEDTGGGPTVTLRFQVDDTANNSVGAISGAAFEWNDFDRSGGDRPVLTNDGSGLWTYTEDIPIPDSDTTYNFGANLSTPAPGTGFSDWIWAYDSRDLGSYTVPADAQDGDVIDIEGPDGSPALTIPEFGDWDVRLTVDTNDLATNDPAFDPSGGVDVKLSRAAFFANFLQDDGNLGDETAGDGIYTFVLSEQIANAPADTPLQAAGLLAPGDPMEFIWRFSATEYKIDGVAQTQGVTVELRNTATGGDWIPMNVAFVRPDRNSAVLATPTRQVDLRVTVDKANIDEGAVEGGVAVGPDTPVFFTSSWIVEQMNGDFTVLPMFDNGEFGDPTADDGQYTFVLGQWVGGEWNAQEVDFRGMSFLARGDDPLGRDPIPQDGESRFKARFDEGGFYGSLDGVTVEYRVPGGDWTEITNIPTVGLGDFQLIIPE